MAIDPKRVQAVFLAAVEQPTPLARAAYLDEACATDGELRQRVEVLLRAHDDPRSFLEQPALGPGGTGDSERGTGAEEGGSNGEATGPPPLAEGPGTVLGPYKLLQQIGEGGMGMVYLAEQAQPVQRKVALKIIKP